ncbi:Alpha-amylase [Hordeum vulgare]|nr:Alpha-amylase [Hordeum vulgare]
MRNDMLHDKMFPPLEISRSFLLSYLSSYSQAHRYGMEDILKGEMPVVDTPSCSVLIQKQLKPWPKPPLGWVALSVDGAFVKDTGRAGSGMILRDSEGAVIFSPYRYIYHCKDALESEISAVLEGVSFSVQQSDLPIVMQYDSSIVVAALPNDSLWPIVMQYDSSIVVAALPNDSLHRSAYEEIKKFSKSRGLFRRRLIVIKIELLIV